MADMLMVFSETDKVIIKHYHKKGYTAYKIWKHNPKKHCGKTLVKQFIKRFEGFGTMERQKGSGWSQTALTLENEKVV